MGSSHQVGFSNIKTHTAFAFAPNTKALVGSKVGLEVEIFSAVARPGFLYKIYNQNLDIYCSHFKITRIWTSTRTASRNHHERFVLNHKNSRETGRHLILADAVNFAEICCITSRVHQFLGVLVSNCVEEATENRCVTRCDGQNHYSGQIARAATAPLVTWPNKLVRP